MMNEALTLKELRETDEKHVWVAIPEKAFPAIVQFPVDGEIPLIVACDATCEDPPTMFCYEHLADVGAKFYRSPPEGEPKASRHRELCLKLNELYRRKNHDYGDSFGQTFKAWGPAAAGVRMSDKLNRFVSLSKSAAEVDDESVVDTLLDLANYAVMTVLEMEDEG